MNRTLLRIVVQACLAVVYAWIARSVDHALAPCKARRLGWLDDDGVPRGERWDGSWFSGPRAALSLA